MAAWPLPSKDVLVGYYEAMKACCRDYMSSVTDEELSATMSLRPGSDPEPKETIMGVLVFDNIVHGGPDSLPARSLGRHGLVRLA